MSYDEYDSEMRMCCVDECDAIIDTSHHEAQLCGRCIEYASGHQGDATRKDSPGTVPGQVEVRHAELANEEPGPGRGSEAPARDDLGELDPDEAAVDALLRRMGEEACPPALSGRSSHARHLLGPDGPLVPSRRKPAP